MGRTIIDITIVGKDQEGVVAAFTSFAFRNGGNIEKINQNVIEGLFGMYLEVSFGDKIDVEDLDRRIQVLAAEHGQDVTVHDATSPRQNIAVFVTKEPLCLETLLGDRDNMTGRICVVVGTDDSLELVAKRAGVPFVSVNHRNKELAEAKLLDICKRYHIDLIVLARYMRILTPNFVWRYPNKIINIHPSLLPAFPGAFAYSQAYERGTKICGVTAHYVTENLDQGPIILQDSFKVDPQDSLMKIKERGQKLESQTLLRAVKLHLANELEVRWRKVYTRGRT